MAKIRGLTRTQNFVIRTSHGERSYHAAGDGAAVADELRRDWSGVEWSSVEKACGKPDRSPLSYFLQWTNAGEEQARTVDESDDRADAQMRTTYDVNV